MSSPTETDVLIVGAGPAGLVAALSLTRLGIRVKIVEWRAPDENGGRADGIQPRTIEIWDNLGVGDTLRKAGIMAYSFATFGPKDAKSIQFGRTSLNVPLEIARYQYEVLVYPKQIEDILKDALAEAKVPITQPAIVTNFEISEGRGQYPVKAEITHFNLSKLKAAGIPVHQRREAAANKEFVDRVETVRARYIIGCDGAHSWLRKQSGIQMVGESPDVMYGIVEFTPDTDFPTIRNKTLIKDASGRSVALIPKPGVGTRVYLVMREGDLDGIEYDGKNTTPQMVAKFCEMMKESFAPYKMGVSDITWTSLYKVSQRVASRFAHKRRLFIAGDAAHMLSPTAAQGANTSMVDVYSLSWKMAQVIRGWSSEAILDTYEIERREFAESLIEFDREMEESFRKGSEAYANLWIRQLDLITGFGLQYNTKSQLIIDGYQEVMAGAIIGRRFPAVEVLRYMDWLPTNTLDIIGYGMKYTLLVFPGNTTEPSIKQHCKDFLSKLSNSKRASLMVKISLILHVTKDDSHLGFLECLGDSIGANIYIDDGITSKRQHGEAYDVLGVSPKAGAAALVRPDGHLGMLIPFSTDGLDMLEDYLYQF